MSRGGDTPENRLSWIRQAADSVLKQREKSYETILKKTSGHLTSQTSEISAHHVSRICGFIGRRVQLYGCTQQLQWLLLQFL
jgi:hypothetical protein